MTTGGTTASCTPSSHDGDVDAVLMELANVHRVVAAAIGKDLHTGLADVVHAIRDHYRLLAVGVVLVDEGPPLVGGSTDPRFAVGGPAEIMDPGPVARVLRTGGVQHSTSEERQRYRASDAARDTIAAVALPGADGVLGALILDKGAHPVPLDDRFLLRLAELLSLVVTSGRAIQHASSIAAEYRALDRMRTDFVAVASHELRTPLTAVVGSLETLLLRGDELSRDDRIVLLDASVRQGHRLVRVVDDLSTVTAADTGDLRVARRSFTLGPAVHQAATTVQDAVASTLDVSVDGARDTVVEGDPGRLVQVVENLVRNAHDHGAERVDIAWTPHGDSVRVSVQDDGPGIPDHVAPHLFDRFTRGRETDRHTRGMGLGLAIARELVEAMGGTLDHDATWTAGARFELTLRRPASTRSSN